jgi:hypothetical protein
VRAQSKLISKVRGRRSSHARHTRNYTRDWLKNFFQVINMHEIAFIIQYVHALLSNTEEYKTYYGVDV